MDNGELIEDNEGVGEGGIMGKSSALELACETFSKFMKTICKDKNCIDCVLFRDSCPCGHVSKDTLKHYFQEQANISDGWDVVKNLYFTFANLQGHNAMTLTIAGQLKEKLEEAGIEVDDEL